MSGHDSRVSRLEGFYPDGAPREPCPSCDGSGMAPSEADVARSLVAYFAAAGEARGFHEPPPELPPSLDEASWDPCRLCRGDLFVTARAVEAHRAAAAHSGAATTRRLAATADALRRCDVRWQRPLSEMSYVERLMAWWNRCEDATGSLDGPSPSGGATQSTNACLLYTSDAADE